jgi:hypothetical protein
MRRLGRYAVLGGAACACAGLATVAEAQFGGTNCSVLDNKPCAPTVCSPLDGEPCQPQYPFPLGENLQVTIDSAQWHQGERVDAEHKIDNIHDLFAALRACWLAPDRGDTHDDLQMSVRFAFKRTGEIIGEPRVTYTTPGLEDDTRKVYRQAITEALDRCTPMPFSKGMGGAIAGRPIAIRYVDKRNRQDREQQP